MTEFDRSLSEDENVRRLKRAFEASAQRILNDISIDPLSSAFSEEASFGKQPTLTSDVVRDWVRTTYQMKRRLRAASITFRVKLGHVGAMIMIDQGQEGKTVMCSPRQAREIYKRWPLKLHRVISPETALFVPALPGELTSAMSIEPPFQMPRPL